MLIDGVSLLIHDMVHIREPLLDTTFQLQALPVWSSKARPAATLAIICLAKRDLWRVFCLKLTSRHLPQNPLLLSTLI